MSFTHFLMFPVENKEFKKKYKEFIDLLKGIDSKPVIFLNIEWFNLLVWLRKDLYASKQITFYDNPVKTKSWKDQKIRRFIARIKRKY